MTWFKNNPWRALVIVAVLLLGGKGGWDFYWWNQWLKQVSYTNQVIVAYLFQPIGKNEKGEDVTRASFLNDAIKNSTKPAEEQK